MLSKCDISGVLELDFESISFHIGDKIDMEDLNSFQNKIIFIAKNKIFIPHFIKFQQGDLNKNNPAHKNIIKKLEELGIDLSLDFIELKRSFEGASKELSSSISNSKGNSKGNSNNNIYNNINIVKQKKQNFDFIENEDWKNLFTQWIEYKIKIKDALKPISYKPAFDKLQKLSNGDLTQAKEIVGNSIANGYKGLFELKNKFQNTINSKPNTNERVKEALINFMEKKC